MKHNFFEVAAILSQVTISEEHQEKLNLFFQQIKQNKKEQNAFYIYCKGWKLAPWICVQIEKFKLASFFEEEILNLFREDNQQIKKANEQRITEALRFLKVFREKGIDVAVLKGNLFMHTIYHEPGYKRMNDFDMLIRAGDWPKVQDIYFDLGYIPLGFGWSGEKQEAASFSHAGMSFISPNYHCITGTQWGLKSPTSKYNKHIIEDIWEQSQPFQLGGLEIKQLSPEYNLLHLVLHMGIYKCGIRDCMDVYNLYKSTNIDEDTFIRIASRANAIDKSYFTLLLTNFCYNDISISLLEKLKEKSKGFILQRARKRMIMAERTGDMQLSYNDYFHDVEMGVFYYNLYFKFHQKLPIYLKIIRLMFWPKSEATLKFCDNSDRPTLWNKLKARIKAPYFVFALIGEEIGIGIVFLLFIKLFVDLLLSVGYYFFRKENYFDYLKKRGIDPKDIFNAVKKIQ